MAVEQEVAVEPDMSWFDIAVTHHKEVVILGNSPGWDDFAIEHWWVDTFANEEPEGLAPGAYRWTGFTIGQWDEDEHLNVTGGDFTPLPAPSVSDKPLMSAGETPPAQLQAMQLLADIELHLQSVRIFLTSREKMHPCGVEIHDELQRKVTAAIEEMARV